MDDSNKKEFWTMINITMELTNHPPLSKEAIITWWHLLKKHDIEIIKKSLDKWVDVSTKPPTPHDVLELCKPKVTIYARLASPLEKESNKQHVEELKEAVKKMTNPRADIYTQWIYKILENHKNYSDISFKHALQAKEKLML